MVAVVFVVAVSFAAAAVVVNVTCRREEIPTKKAIRVRMFAKDGVIAKIPVYTFLILSSFVQVDVLIELGR